MNPIEYLITIAICVWTLILGKIGIYSAENREWVAFWIVIGLLVVTLGGVLLWKISS